MDAAAHNAAAHDAAVPDAARLLVATIVWTMVWLAPLPRLGRWTELAAGLIPFAAFGLRVFAGFFVGVPEDDPVRMAVGPVVTWVEGRAGVPPYAWVLDATVAVGLVWLATAFDIPRHTRLATAWLLPAIAALSWWSLRARGLPIERWLAAVLPAPLLGLLAGSLIGAILRWAPSPIPLGLRRRSAAMAIVIVPLAVAAGCVGLRVVAHVPPEHAAQAESIVALATGSGGALAGLALGGFSRSRSRWLFALCVGVAAGAVIALEKN